MGEFWVYSVVFWGLFLSSFSYVSDSVSETMFDALTSLHYSSQGLIDL